MKNPRHIAQNAFLCMVILACWFHTEAAASAVSALSTGDSYCSFFWTQSTGDTFKIGYYGVLKIGSQSQGALFTTDSATFRLDRSSWWQRTVANVNTNIEFVFSTAKPDSIDLCSAKFAPVPWLQSITGKTDTAEYAIRFLFPVLPIGQNYGRYDYFTVRLNDTMEIHFQGINDTTLTASFVNQRIPGSITKIYAKNAITVRTTATNSFRIRNIQIDGAYERFVSAYLRFDLSSLKKNAGFYGLALIDTTIAEQAIQVSGVTISGAPALSADSTYQLTWSMLGASNVARCSLYVSLDSATTWLAAGMTAGTLTAYQWTAPRIESQHCFIKVLAIDKNGQKYPGYSQIFSITLPSVIPLKQPPVNNYSLRGTALTPTTIRLAWSLAGPADTSVDSVGVRYDVMHYPSSMTDTLSTLVGIFNLSDTCDTSAGLPLNQPYYFSLFVANGAGVWSDATQNSILLIRSSQPTGAVVSLGTDTQHVFNDSLRLWTKPRLLIAFSDTLDQWNGPQLKPGFIQTSQGFAFRQGNTPPGTSVGISISYRAIPSPYSDADQRVYQYNIFTGKWRLVPGGPKVHTDTRVIDAVCQDARMPFMVMIDTLAPRLSRISSGKNYYTVQQTIVDTCVMTDNIENVSLRLLGGAGSADLGDLSAYVTPADNESRYIVSIPRYVADQCSGLRAYLIANDGRNAVRINLSEKILRDGANCDDTTAGAEQWTPLFVTAQPENPLLSKALFSASSYNTKNERIIQWRPDAANGTGLEAWLDYKSGGDPEFPLEPGKLFWMKSRNSRSIHYGTAIVPAFVDTFEIQLNPKGWTDFSIPYRGDIYVGDIIEATRKTNGGWTDSIGIYQWIQSASNLITDAVFLYGIGDRSNPARIIHGGKPYSAYNPLPDTVTLRIPPDGLALSPLNPFGAMAKKSSPGLWSIQLGITCHDSVRLSSIYCASTPPSGIPRWYPVSPSFAPVTIGIKNRSNDHIYGHTASGELSAGGCMFELRSENTALEAVPVGLYIENAAGLPPGIAAGLFTTSDKRNALHDSLRFSLNPQQISAQYLIVGSKDYIKRTSALLSTKLKLRVIHGQGIRIAYTVPYDTRSLEFVLYDLKGRCIWEETYANEPSAVQGTHMVTKPVAAGFYLLELKASVSGEKIPRIIRQKVIHFR
jgi:hypothetical protein